MHGQTLLQLCTIQAANGSASDVSTFGPVGYSTSQNAGDSYGIVNSTNGAVEREVGIPWTTGLGLMAIWTMVSLG